MTRRAAVLISLAAAFLPPVCSAAADSPGSPVPVAAVGAPIPAEAPAAASLLRPVTVRAAFRVPRADTALYVGTPWFVRDLSVTVIGPGSRRETIAAGTGLPGRMLGLRLPADAWQADRVELQATTVSTAAPPYLLPAEQLAQIGWRNWSYAAFFGLFLALALLHAMLALVFRSRAAGWYAAFAAAQAGLLIPWLGVVRPRPEISQPLHATLQSLAFAGLALFTLAYLRTMRPPRLAVRALWALVLLNAVIVAGGDVLQDLWTLPDGVTQALALALMLAFVALGVIAVRRNVAGALFYLAGTACADLGLLIANLPLPLGTTAQQTAPLAGNALAAVLLALALATQLRRAEIERTQRVQLDGLTEIPNRTALDERRAAEWNRARRARSPLAALLVDVDHFTSYNETYGHLAGDDVLRRVAAALAKTISRADDLAGRHDGDKFLVLLPDTGLAGAQRVAAAVRAAVAALELAHGGIPSKRVTVSIGVASLVPADYAAHAQDGDELLRRAETALHVAKAMGRNRAVANEPIASPVSLR